MRSGLGCLHLYNIGYRDVGTILGNLLVDADMIKVVPIKVGVVEERSTVDINEEILVLGSLINSFKVTMRLW